MRLYLNKDANRQLFIDFPKPPDQDLIDGIRFLYKQFKKKNPGVILNDPPGFPLGECKQVALFVKAIRPLLQRPLLVICPKENSIKWRNHLLEWAGFSENDIAVETSNAFAKHLVFINSIEDVAAFSRRHWSIVVVENHDFHIDTANVTKKVLYYKLNAEYKIWVTSVDIQTNLDKLPALYRWLNPEDKINVQDIISTKGNGLKDEVDNLIILDAFLANFVIRRNNFLTPFKTVEIEKSIADVHLQEETRKRSRKCKDITGKKVKRSKKRVIEDNDEGHTSIGTVYNATINVEEVATTVNVTGVAAASRDDDSIEYFNFRNNKNNEVTENNEMDVETFIRDQEPINSVQSNNVNDMSQSEANTSDFVNAVNDIVNNENNISREENDSPSLFENVKEKQSPSLFKYVKENQMEVDDSNTEVPITLKLNDTLVSTSKDIFKDVKIEKEIAGTLNNNVKVSENNNVDLTIKKVDSILNKTEEIADVKVENSQEIKVENGKASDNVNNNNCKTSTNGHEKVNVKEKETSSNASQKVDKEISVKKETESNTIVKKGITDQIADLEKEALNKYKGSILDSLFRF